MAQSGLEYNFIAFQMAGTFISIDTSFFVSSVWFLHKMKFHYLVFSVSGVSQN